MWLVFILSLWLIPHMAHAWFYGRPEPGAFTKGGVWPLPWKIVNDTIQHHTLNPQNFKFQSNQLHPFISRALKRYKRLTFPDYKNNETMKVDATLIGLDVTVKEIYNGSYPQFDMDESYSLIIGTGNSVTANLTANFVWGALRGLETFSQLVYQTENNIYQTYSTRIEDKPRFPHRGTLIDSSRHFLSVSIIKRHLDLMAQNKMNVLHWHLVDSEAFPYPSEIYRNLTAKGAYTSKHQYTRTQISDILEYAKNRGIRVVAEFDTPGHMGAWGPGIDGLLSKCYDSQGQQNILSNIFDPTKEQNFEFLKEFFKEAFSTFKDDYMHFGGDEVSSYMLQCWHRNREVTDWMHKNNFGDDVYKVLNYYFQRLFNITSSISQNRKRMIVWQEVLDNQVTAPDVIAHVWKGSNYREIMAEMELVTRNHSAILSSCWYLNYIKYGSDWGYLDSPNLRLRGLYYQCDPTDFDGTEEQKKRVLGGEVTMWGEYVDGTNLIQRMWPRASAVAERLWSDPAQTKSADDAWPRLHEHRCRMLRRGYAVQPINNPNYCPVYWDPKFPDEEE